MLKLSNEERDNLLRSVGSHKTERPLSPIEVASLLTRLTADHRINEIATEAGLSDTTILKQLISLKSLPDETQLLVVWGAQSGKLSFSVAAELARIKDKIQVAELAELALMYKLSKSELRLILKSSRDSGKKISFCVEEAVHQRRHQHTSK